MARECVVKVRVSHMELLQIKVLAKKVYKTSWAELLRMLVLKDYEELVMKPYREQQAVMEKQMMGYFLEDKNESDFRTSEGTVAGQLAV